MASKLVQLVEILSSRGGIVKTSTAPNSWAAIALWRRFFELKKQEEEEKLDEVAEIIEDAIDVHEVEPISAPENIRLRCEFSQQPNRDLVRQYYHQQQRPEPEVVQNPNLQVRVTEDDYLYMAQ